MRLAGVSVSLALLVLLAVLPFKGRPVSGHIDRYVQEACRVTRYQDICIRSLAPFSNSARRSPSWWARAGVSVALKEVKAVAQYLEKSKRDGQMHGRRQRMALSDCTECFQDSIDNLHRCLGILRDLTEKGQLGSEINDLITWMSAALTNEDTCLDGFEGQKAKQVKLIRQKVLGVTYLTSNALALANKLANTMNPN
ncbi:hypothetical protein CRG98_006608 [Punica granatum]|uniref:Pectinesterase inhibitor domain-containing protein n=1 Tax=Punica granatum TaxID=22663 RepID=A0A2I0KWZ6_PUNGR|nr:hypothetical protein CRG98_006608 [Punica granatum]